VGSNFLKFPRYFDANLSVARAQMSPSTKMLRGRNHGVTLETPTP
jgi:hypothetical protein